MSHEQLLDQEVQTEGSSSATSTTEETYGLPPGVHDRVMRLAPGNVDGLCDLLALYPTFTQGILSVASHHMGAAAVRRARESLAQPRRPLTQDQIRPGGEFELEGGPPRRPLTQDQIRPGGEFELESGPPRRPLTQDQIRPGGEFELEGGPPTPRRPLTQEQIRPGGEFELEGGPPRRPLTQEQIRPGGEFELEGNAPDPVFLSSAQRYNAAHTSFVDEFNDLTNGSCLVSGQLDPQAVARWQAQHGLAPDGKVGPLTLASARKVRVSASAEAETDARPPV